MVADADFEGGCLCGAVRYRASEPPVEVSFCHCSMCRRQSGSAFGVFATFAKSALTFTGATPAVYRSSDFAQRRFCARCGTPLTFEYLHRPDYPGIAVGTLDHPEFIRPSVHWGVESMLPWVRLVDDLPRRRTDDDPEFVHATGRRASDPMEKFTTLTGVAAPLNMINVDTDMIIPKQFLKTIKRTGLGKHLFNDLRFTPDGREVADFVLNRPAFRQATILVAGRNFGCGSSREHAPWALLDFGIRCVIASSFADIFYNNCFKNGILPATLPEDQVQRLLAQAEHGANATFTVDLEQQVVSAPDGSRFRFEIEPFRRLCLLDGLDDIGQTLAKADAIGGFEQTRRARQPWLVG